MKTFVALSLLLGFALQAHARGAYAASNVHSSTNRVYTAAESKALLTEAARRANDWYSQMVNVGDSEEKANAEKVLQLTKEVLPKAIAGVKPKSGYATTWRIETCFQIPAKNHFAGLIECEISGDTEGFEYGYLIGFNAKENDFIKILDSSRTDLRE